MAGHSLRDSELVEILQQSDDSSGDSDSIFSSSSSEYEVYDVAVANAVVNDESSDEDEVQIVQQNYMWETMDNYTGQKEIFSGDFGPKNGAENITSILESFELFFDKGLIQLTVRETNRYAEQYKNARGNLFTLRSPVQKWTPVTENEIYTV